MADTKVYVPQSYKRDNVAGFASDIYDFSVHGGAVGTITLPLELPDNAIILRGWVDVITAPTSGGSATIALGLNTNTDLRAASAIATYTGIVPLLPGTVNAASASATEPLVPAPLKLTADRKLKVTIATAALTAGKLAFIFEIAGPFEGVQPVTYLKG